MAAIDFPNSPTLNQQFTSGDKTWVWNGSSWLAYRAAAPITLSGTQTLTNKTISGSANTLSDIPESAVTNLTSDLSAKETPAGAQSKADAAQAAAIASSAGSLATHESATTSVHGIADNTLLATKSYADNAASTAAAAVVEARWQQCCSCGTGRSAKAQPWWQLGGGEAVAAARQRNVAWRWCGGGGSVSVSVSGSGGRATARRRRQLGGGAKQ